MYVGTDCPTGPVHACNDDGPDCANFTSLMLSEVNEGTTYLLRVGGFGDPAATGSGTLSVTCGVGGPGQDGICP